MGAFVCAVLGLGGLGAVWAFARSRRPRERLERCGHCGGARVLLDEETDNVHLDATQRREEQLGAADYNVWWCAACEDGVVVRNSLFTTSLVTCGKCGLGAAMEKSQTLQPATPSQGGEFRIHLSCGNCGHSQQFWRYTPRLPVR